MNEIKLLRIALLIGIAGIICLFFLSQTIEAQPIGIGQITEEMIGKKVSIQGVVESIEAKKSATILTIAENEKEIAVVVFSKEQDSMKQELPIVGETVAITGTVKEYYGTLEIMVERIEPV